MLKEVVEQEWHAVKDLPSLRKHYKTQTLYQRWRYQFMKYGFVERVVKNGCSPIRPCRKEYMKNYAKVWRKKNPDKARVIIERYWRRKLGFVSEHTSIPTTEAVAT
jgi:hypothetical protein